MMAKCTFTQTPWEETEEEARIRVKKSQTSQSNWLTTLMGLVIGTATLSFLLLTR